MALQKEPAVTRNQFGKGTAIYLGTILDEKAMASLLTSVWTEAGVTSVAAAPAGVEVVRRRGLGRSFLFVLNHHDAEMLVPAIRGVDLISGESVGPGGLHLPAFGVAVIAEVA